MCGISGKLPSVIMRGLIAACLLLVRLTGSSSLGMYDAGRPCMEEEYDVDRFYMYKANAAQVVMRGVVLNQESVSYDVDANLQSFIISNASLYKGEHLFNDIEKRNLYVLFGKNRFYVNLKKSQCNTMRVFKKFQVGEEFLFFLSKSSEPDKFSMQNLPLLETPTLTLFAQPDVYKRKIDRVLKGALFCDTCTPSPPAVTRGWDDSLLEQGQNVSFTCGLGGLPKPNNTVLFNGQPILPDQHVSLQLYGRKVVLTLTDIKKEHEGVYTCKGTNFFDTPRQTSAYLKVIDRVEQEAANTQPCPPHFQHYCYNGGTCFWLVREQVKACHCHGIFSGDRCQDILAPQKLIADQDEGVNVWTLCSFVLMLFILAFFVIIILSLTYARQQYRIRRMKKQFGSRVPIDFDYDIELPRQASPAPVKEVNYSALSSQENHPPVPERSPYSLLPQSRVNHPGGPVSPDSPNHHPLPPSHQPRPVLSREEIDKLLPKYLSEPEHVTRAPDSQDSGIEPDQRPGAVRSPGTSPIREETPLPTTPTDTYRYSKQIPQNFPQIQQQAKETDIIESDSSSGDNLPYIYPSRTANLR